MMDQLLRPIVICTLQVRFISLIGLLLTSISIRRSAPKG